MTFFPKTIEMLLSNYRNYNRIYNRKIQGQYQTNGYSSDGELGIEGRVNHHVSDLERENNNGAMS